MDDDFTVSEMTSTAYMLTVNTRNLSLYSLHVKSTVPLMRLHSAYYSVATKSNTIQSWQSIHAIR